MCQANLDSAEETEKGDLEGSGCDYRVTEINPFSSLSLNLFICEVGELQD